MTICIAAISENKHIVTIADKKLTVNQGVTSGYQINENKKIVELNKNCVALFAGNIVNANEVLAIAKKQIKATDNVLAIVDKIKLAYQQRFREAVDDEILSKYGLDLDTFNSQQRTLEPSFVNTVIQVLDNPETSLGIQIIVAGIDDKGPQLFRVSHPGAVTDETPVGYVSVGSGSSHANLSLMESQCHLAIDSESLVYAVLKAKRKAEYDPNVGDMSTLVLINDKVKWIDEENIKKIWHEYESSVVNISIITKKSSKIMKGHIWD